MALMIVLSTIKTAQMQNGVRAITHDYKRYQSVAHHPTRSCHFITVSYSCVIYDGMVSQYATRRIRRVSKSIGFTHGKNVYKSRVWQTILSAHAHSTPCSMTIQ